ncbi:hypothetical protein A2755_00625 [Candidatus Wolfebacteria bacterium RIFCSPHIGHO2_01_FULL_48_22]|uniref:Uncharacterized protein n=2 Tax=Candidatus Wolfeibacteriota TaxID=1752735 RepID=A0A1F8DTW6_9BACT|nr:MAG: hypothetical protein A2755_00625 [Candidatus Wolfebacteria bacterium RIFCSPHIGHO2_01_FULL_48_22]OGM94058.1 MAG: hypothetical protein A2935_02775 [Candidatus Wolfebacteria bacterium RIFCSPLOWO2_01_FULL_47_17b]
MMNVGFVLPNESVLGSVKTEARKAKIIRSRWNPFFFDGIDYNNFFGIDDVAPEINEQVLLAAREVTEDPFVFYPNPDIHLGILEAIMEKNYHPIEIQGGLLRQGVRDMLKREKIETGWYASNCCVHHLGLTYDEHVSKSHDMDTRLINAVEAINRLVLYFLKNSRFPSDSGVIRTSTRGTITCEYGEFQVELGVAVFRDRVQVLPYTVSEPKMGIITFKKLFIE